MLYNQHLEPISTEVTVGTVSINPSLHTQDLQSSIKTLISIPILPPPGRAHIRRRPKSETY